MKRLRKSNRVSWAPGANLRQVKLFLVEDCPSKVGNKPESNLKAKPSLKSHPSGMNTSLHPGLGGSRGLSNLKNSISYIPRVQWKSPPKFIVSPNWQVVAGEESQEVGAQTVRQMKVFEAMYPRLSDVPPSPAVSIAVDNEYYNDRRTPLVPLTPIEDEEEDTDVPSDIPAQKNIPQNPFTHVASNTEHIKIPEPVRPANAKAPTHVAPNTQHHKILEPVIPANAKPPTHVAHTTQHYKIPEPVMPANAKPPTHVAPTTQHHKIPEPVLPANAKRPSGGINPDVMVAASAVLATLLKTKEQGSMIDTDLLVKILTDPKKVEELVKDQRALSSNANAIVSAATVTTSSRPTPSQITPMSVTASTPSPAPYTAPSPTPYSAPYLPSTPAIRESNHTLNSFKPSAPATSVIAPVSSMPAPAPSLPLSRPATGNVCSIPNRMQPAVSVMPVQQNSVPKVQPTISTVPVSIPPIAAPANPNPVKDINYFKNLIREHGGQEKQDSSYPANYNQVPAAHNLKSGQQVNLKNGKPCMYFGTAKGCRKGDSCHYLHDMSGNWRTGNALEVPSAKRMKMVGEITGR